MDQNDPARAHNRTVDEIRARGAIFNINHGIEFEDGDHCTTRLIGFPGNGTRMVSFHLLTHRPKGSYAMHRHLISEESMICVRGRGEVDLGRGFVPVAAGNFVYVPAGVEHATRAAADADEDFVVLSYHCPPALEYYQQLGVFRNGAFDRAAIDGAMLAAKAGNVPSVSVMGENQLGGAERGETKGAQRVAREGGVFNMYRGAHYTMNGGLMRFVLWPGAGTRLVAQHIAFHEPGIAFRPHVHPNSEDAVFVAAGRGACYLESRWIDTEAGDILYAPALVRHGTAAWPDAKETFICTGCASPPQFDLYEHAGYLKDGRFTEFDWK